METKYYVPELEEFHFEFRYQRYTTYDGGKWLKRQAGWRVRDENHMKADILNGNIRVKCLDHDDIIELGWERDEDMDRGDYQMYFLELEDGAWSGFSLLKHIESNEVIIHQVHKKIGQLDTIRFHGDIKNYNTLKTLMKWLDIK